MRQKGGKFTLSRHSPTLNLCSSCKWLPHLLPPRDQQSNVLQESGVILDPTASTVNLETHVDSSALNSLRHNVNFSDSLRHLLDETADIIESPLFNNVLTLLLDAAFSQLTDNKLRSEAYKLPPLGKSDFSQDASLHKIAHASTKLASILAVMTREAHQIGRGLPNEYVQALENVSDLEGFAAVIYSSNSDSASSSAQSQPSEDVTFEDTVSSLPDHETHGPTERVTGLVDSAWSGFQSVWAKVSG